MMFRDWQFRRQMIPMIPLAVMPLLAVFGDVEADALNHLVLTVHDANVHGRSYKFNLLIQKVDTGEIGVIDPQINNG